MSEKKCDKYESLFVFGTQEQLEKHLAECSDCREEHEKMNKTSCLVKEVAPYYEDFDQKQHKPFIMLKAVAGLTIIALAYFLINQSIMDNNIEKYNISYNGGSDSIISEMGLPTDDYGLLMVY